MPWAKQGAEVPKGGREIAIPIADRKWGGMKKHNCVNLFFLFPSLVVSLLLLTGCLDTDGFDSSHSGGLVHEADSNHSDEDRDNAEDEDSGDNEVDEDEKSEDEDSDGGSEDEQDEDVGDNDEPTEGDENIPDIEISDIPFRNALTNCKPFTPVRPMGTWKLDTPYTSAEGTEVSFSGNLGTPENPLLGGQRWTITADVAGGSSSDDHWFWSGRQTTQVRMLTGQANYISYYGGVLFDHVYDGFFSVTLHSLKGESVRWEFFGYARCSTVVRSGIMVFPGGEIRNTRIAGSPSFRYADQERNAPKVRFSDGDYKIYPAQYYAAGSLIEPRDNFWVPGPALQYDGTYQSFIETFPRPQDLIAAKPWLPTLKWVKYELSKEQVKFENFPGISTQLRFFGITQEQLEKALNNGDLVDNEFAPLDTQNNRGGRYKYLGNYYDFLQKYPE